MLSTPSLTLQSGMTQFLLDRVTSAIGVLFALTLQASAWKQLKFWIFVQTSLIWCLFLAVGLLSTFRPRLYGRHRTAIFTAIKGIATAHRFHNQVKLNRPPTGRLGRDLVNAVLGLRFFGLALAGLLHCDWMVWVVQQAALLASMLNLDIDCSTPLLDHPITAERISKLHAFMEAISFPQLHRQGGVVPRTQLGQCKAAVVFLGPIVGILLPALLLLPPPRLMENQRENKGLLSKKIQGLLLVLRFDGGQRWGAPWSVLAWWLVLVLLWLFSVLLFTHQ